MMVFDNFGVLLDQYVFFPLQGLEPTHAIAFLAICLSVLFAVLNKILVDQDKLKYIKEEMKKIQKEIKKAQKKKDDKALKALWEKSMKINHQQLTMVLKPMLFSSIFVILIFPWMKYAYSDAIFPVNDSSVTFDHDDVQKQFSIELSDDGILSIRGPSGKTYTEGDKIELADRMWILDYRPPEDSSAGEVVFRNMRVGLPFSLPFVGNDLGWLGFYILVSIPSTILARKLLGVQ